MKYLTTPDGRYFVHNGRLWRCTNPSLNEDNRQHFVNQLMDARRAVKAAKGVGDEVAIATARRRVNHAKIALGERGPTWWDDDSDHNQKLIANTPYADWWENHSGS